MMTVGSFIECADRDYGAEISVRTLEKLGNPDKSETRSFKVLMEALDDVLKDQSGGGARPSLGVIGIRPVRGRLIFKD